MTPDKGMIVLMGSGELTATMVEVHKEVLRRLGESPKAVFLDTPAGFQLNADELSQRAVAYFRRHVQHDMSVVSFKSKDIPPVEAEQAYTALRACDYALVGPGSPTYAVRQWLQTPVPSIITKRIREGACFVAASAAALTVGRFTMPVYEIYKVGHELHWAEGMDILGSFGFSLVVIPHWNNAEGGTHDTRRCFMGEERFRDLMSLLPGDTGILGLDEHTACVMDLRRNEGEIRGIGTITFRHGSGERVFQKGERFSLDILRGLEAGPAAAEARVQPVMKEEPVSGDESFWQTVHDIEDAFHRGLEHDQRDAANAVLELDRTIWKAMHDLENQEFVTQAREILREFIVLMGTRPGTGPVSAEACMGPLVDALLKLREAFRKNQQWQESDAIRDCLKRVNITVEDTDEGARWRLTS